MNIELWNNELNEVKVIRNVKHILLSVDKQTWLIRTDDNILHKLSTTKYDLDLIWC